jgi:hypothetical protein
MDKEDREKAPGRKYGNFFFADAIKGSEQA